MQGEHGSFENWPGTGYAGGPPHGAVVKVSYPDANREVTCKSDAPIVPEVGGGAGLDCSPEGEAKRGVGTKGRRASRVVAQDVRYQVTMLGIGDLVNLRVMSGFCLIKDEAGRLEGAQSRKGRIGIRQVEERDLCVSNGEAQSVGYSRLVECFNTDSAKQGVKRDRSSNRIQGSHRSDVERIVDDRRL